MSEAAYESVAEFKVGYGTVTTSRIPVPGGWLYTTSSVTAYGASVHSTFVPTPVDEGTFSGISRDAFGPGGLDRHRR